MTTAPGTKSAQGCVALQGGGRAVLPFCDCAVVRVALIGSIAIIVSGIIDVARRSG